MFNSGMGLGKRLNVSFTVIMAVLAILSSSRIAALDAEIGIIVDDYYPKTNIANHVKAQINENSTSWRHQPHRLRSNGAL